MLRKIDLLICPFETWGLPSPKLSFPFLVIVVCQVHSPCAILTVLSVPVGDITSDSSLLAFPVKYLLMILVQHSRCNLGWLRFFRKLNQSAVFVQCTGCDDHDECESDLCFPRTSCYDAARVDELQVTEVETPWGKGIGRQSGPSQIQGELGAGGETVQTWEAQWAEVWERTGQPSHEGRTVLLMGDNKTLSSLSSAVCLTPWLYHKTTQQVLCDVVFRFCLIQQLYCGKQLLFLVNQFETLQEQFLNALPTVRPYSHMQLPVRISPNVIAACELLYFLTDLTVLHFDLDFIFLKLLLKYSLRPT